MAVVLVAIFPILLLISAKAAWLALMVGLLLLVRDRRLRDRRTEPGY